MERPEHIDFIIGISHNVRHDTTYSIEFRAWQLEELREYIKYLEAENRRTK
jgi:hypothetical protein